jgi:hypothetical protein
LHQIIQLQKGVRMTSTHSTGHTESFDFDEWQELAIRDPEGFERRRQAVIENYLSSLPISKQRRLRGLQFRIDMERRRARSAMGACIKLSSMMWDALVGPDGLKTSLQMLTTSAPQIQKPEQVRNAQVLSFRK